MFAKGAYNPYNKWNTTDGVVHLTHPANSLRAEINLAGDGTVLRTDSHGQPVTGAAGVAGGTPTGVGTPSGVPTGGGREPRVIRAGRRRRRGPPRARRAGGRRPASTGTTPRGTSAAGWPGPGRGRAGRNRP